MWNTGLKEDISSNYISYYFPKAELITAPSTDQIHSDTQQKYYYIIIIANNNNSIMNLQIDEYAFFQTRLWRSHASEPSIVLC